MPRDPIKRAEWVARNKARRSAENKQYRIENNAAIRAQERIYRAGRKDVLAANARRYREVNKDRVRAISRESKRRGYAADPSRERELAWRVKGIILSWQDYLAMLASQSNKCPGCGRGIVAMKSQLVGNMGVAHVDHDHVTGRIRGLLCTLCNMAIGHASDDPFVLRRLATYLESGGSYVA